MKQLQSVAAIMLVFILLAGCASQQPASILDTKPKIGIMLSDAGLGDQSFSDSAFKGLEKARNEGKIFFDYRELKDAGTYEKGLTDLVESGNDLIIALGFMEQEDLEKVAKKYSNKKFILIDAVSELKNVTSITFKENQGSFLAGVAAALVTKTNTIGFIGGDDVPLIHKFADGFEHGIKAVNPAIKINKQYAGNFGDDKLGADLAEKMIKDRADVIYAAAGFTGVGALKKAQENHVYAIGVDTDQYFYAEKAVFTSMVKNVDSAIYDVIKNFADTGKLPEGHIELGLDKDGVGLAPIRIIELSPEQKRIIEQWTGKVKNGEAEAGQ
ncbi:BMP family ABC transporter substrate-binding protein [Metabacillus sp. GX 13764]|uniref:BMP family lipoprotein n=1 Tax=Metabacillus kandeliae TaxID=2900151 RepID=UPI001E30C553|nr:BMP family ABC transporter substrate-binding protein [Metabacillus kandeliae]MCD7034936.1 BMP family ABC transporter substrate-binding protein [Metabacillus kandeliae]